MKQRLPLLFALPMLAVLLWGSGSASAESKPETKAPVAGPTGAANGKVNPLITPPAESGMATFCKLLPLNTKNLKVRIPSFTDGQRTALIQARSMTRVDDDNMDLEKMSVILYSKTPDMNLNVEMREATYHLPTEIIYSQNRSRISRSDFRIDGDTLIFDTHTQQGKLTGHCVMVIYDSNSFSKGPVTGTGPEKPKDATTPKSPASTAGNDVPTPNPTKK